MPTTGIETREATAATCARATGRTAAPESPPVPPPSQRRNDEAWGADTSDGSRAVARSVLIKETASAPPSSAALAHSPTSAQLGVSFTIKGLVVAGRTVAT